MGGIRDEDSIARLLNSHRNSPGGLNTAFLYGEKFLEEYDHRTLRVNADLMGFDERGRYPGTVYTDEDVYPNVWISFEESSEFPESNTAQTILASEEPSGAGGEIIRYTLGLGTDAMHDVRNNLDGHDRDSGVDWTYNPETMN